MKKVLVSAGHCTIKNSNYDSGAVGNGFLEANEALRLRDATAKNLREKGVTVLEDGADGISEPLTKAIALARQADVAVEFHFNAGPSAATGIEILAKLNKKSLSQKLGLAIATATGLKLRGEVGWKRDDSGPHKRLGFCESGGLIIEVCFISNAGDMKAYQKNFDAIARNVADVLATA